MTNVHWSIVDDNLEWLSLACFEPVLAYPEIVKSRDFDNQSSNNYLKCPAIVDFLKNTYVIKSPVDLHFSFNSKNNWVELINKDQKFYDSFVLNRCDVRTSENAPMLITLRLWYLFVSDKSCLLEMFSPFMHLDKCVSQMRLLAGSFDISKWFRHIEIVFEVVDPSKDLIIKRGDALAYIKFKTFNNERINLIQKMFNADMRKEINKCLSVKTVLKNQPLNNLYELAKRINKKIFGFKK